MPCHLFKYPIPKLTLTLIVGILISKEIHWPIMLIMVAMTTVLAVAIASQFFRTVKAKILGHYAALALVFFMGVFCHLIHQPTFNPKHYSHRIHHNHDDAPKNLILKLNKAIKPTAYNWRYYAEIVQLDSQPVCGKILLNITKDSISKALNVGDIMIVYAPLKLIEGPKIPHGFRDGLLLKIHKTDTIKHRFIDNYAVGEGLSNIEIEPLKPLYRISNSNLLLVDSLGIYDFKSVTIDWVLLRESPKIHLENLIKALNPSRIIADGSNYKNNAIMWKKTCANYGIKFHDTSVDGAFIVPLNL